MAVSDCDINCSMLFPKSGYILIPRLDFTDNFNESISKSDSNMFKIYLLKSVISFISPRTGITAINSSPPNLHTIPSFGKMFLILRAVS